MEVSPKTYDLIFVSFGNLGYLVDTSGNRNYYNHLMTIEIVLFI